MPAYFTIGHSTRSVSELAALLQGAGVKLLADVRAIPRSRTNPQFNIDALPPELAAYGIGYEHFPELADVTVEAVYRIDTEGLRSADALVAWLDGAMVDDGTACEIGMFAELARSDSERYRGIVAIATDLRLERRRRQGVVGGGMNLFVGGAIESCGKIVHAVDEVVAALREL